MTQAHEAAETARLAVEAGFFTRAISNAYYAMLYAARAALSEEDRYAKTHSGTWNLFRETFVETGRFDRGLLSAARAQQRPREGADYDAEQFSREQAANALELAETFVAAVSGLIGD